MEIYVIDEQPPEANAMLQALYSRSPKSVREHLKAVEARGSSSFMQQYLVQYGHKSIGDCGTTTVFIENVSLLAAKAIQDWPLYNGQEVSTRYLDMTQQSCVEPTRTMEACKLLEKTMTFYSHLLLHLTEHLKEQYPIKGAEDEKVWLKAIKARAFDIARGFLPAGVTTNLSWHTNLRQASDHLKQLRHHPLLEARELAEEITKALQSKYPSSFLHKRYPEEECYLHETRQEHAYCTHGSRAEDLYAKARLRKKTLREFSYAMLNRPARVELPRELKMAGDVTFGFDLDFGSYRDLQRHRGVTQYMPLHTEEGGFEQWYLDQLSPELLEEALSFLRCFEESLVELRLKHKTTAADEQYFIPLGYKMTVTLRGGLPALVYLAELRSSQHVHPTLRRRAIDMGDWLEENVEGLTMHHDRSDDTWSIKRGEQDIVERK